ncbi:MAG: tRNA 2-thiocytidine biosynthesis protein TtcA [Simkaniaceae bacterium]|nr:tRNA 2-thiocytidine biosynthesis protein TtcA [Simkaniaceae bacterium]
MWTKLGKKLESTCRKALFDYNLIVDNTPVAIALSGGKDSITLLYLLHLISGKGFPPFDLHAIHVSGEFSCGASVHEDYLKKICDKLNVSLTICESQQKKETLACYRCSRERRRLIFDAAKEKGCKMVAFGHHRDDSIETLLMNLLHKAEFAANLPKVPMIDYGITIIRPLIYISEKEILSFAKLNGFARITCQCPVGQNSKRRSAKNLLDEMERCFPNTRKNLAQVAKSHGLTKALNKKRP